MYRSCRERIPAGQPSRASSRLYIMSNSPFQNKTAEKIVMTYVQDELFPLVNRIKDFNEKVFEEKSNFLTTFYNTNLNKLVTEYQGLSKEFFVSYRKFTTPDILFADINGDKMDPRIMADYFNFQTVVNKQLDEGFKLLEIGDRNLDRKINFVTQNISQAIAVFAIVASLLAVDRDTIELNSEHYQIGHACLDRPWFQHETANTINKQP